MADQIDLKPIPPGSYDCCESGCDVCVWDVYRENLAAWKERQKERDKIDDDGVSKD